MNAAAQSNPDRARQRGLTLLELVVVSAILVVVGALVHATFRYQTQSYARETAQSVTQRDLRVWMGRMVQDIRQAAYDPTESESFTILAASTNELRFTLDANANGVVDAGPSEHKGYRIQGGTVYLWRGGDDWRPLFDGIEGGTFQYFDAAGNPTSDRRAIREVEIVLTALADGTGVHGPVPVVSRIQRATIRNPLSR